MQERKRRVPFQTTLLRMVATSGGVAIALAAPKMTRLLKEFDRAAIHRRRIEARTQQALARLEKKGLVEIGLRRGKPTVVLTDTGHDRIEEILFEEYQVPEPAFWDGKWRIVLFDIPEARRSKRDELRRFLEQAGFKRLQDSAWVFPYPCDECIELIRARIMRGKDELISFVAEGLPNDRHLRVEFNLK